MRKQESAFSSYVVQKTRRIEAACHFQKTDKSAGLRVVLAGGGFPGTLLRLKLKRRWGP